MGYRKNLSQNTTFKKLEIPQPYLQKKSCLTEKDHSLFIKGNDQKWRVLGLKKCPLVAGFEVPTDKYFDTH
jgi:hypothetical protein